MLLRFLHGGDLHLDSPFHALTPKQAVKAREEQRLILDRICDLVKEEDVQLVFLSGDLFDSQRIYPETLKAFRQALSSLEAQVFISPGNHDPFTDTSPYAKLSWPSHIHIFRHARVESVVLPELGCAVHGGAFTAMHRTAPPLEDFTAPEDELIHFGCFHGEVTQGFSRYGPIKKEHISASKLHYLALGHVHNQSGLKRVGSTYYAYPGCPQGRGFDETGEKGVYLGTTDGKSLGMNFVPICHRQYRMLNVDITGKIPELALRAFLPALRSPDILRIILTGERGDEEALPMPFLHNIAAEFFFSVSLEDQTRMNRDLWSRQREETLLGLFLREMQQRIDLAPPEERPQLELATRFGLHALEGREAPE